MTSKRKVYVIEFKSKRAKTWKIYKPYHDKLYAQANCDWCNEEQDDGHDYRVVEYVPKEEEK